MVQHITIRIGGGLLSLVAVGALLAPAATADDDAREKIRVLEGQLAQKNGQFDWALHNELRHYYGAVDRDKEFHHTNVILKHSLLDSYTMNILSGWELDKDRDKALANLRRVAAARGKYPFVAAACWIKAGELENAGPQPAAERSRESFQNALKTKGDGLEPYHHLAGKWLGNLGPAGQP